MSEPKTKELLEASGLAYTESQAGKAETTNSNPSESTLLNDLDLALARDKLSGWTPILVQYLPSIGLYAAAFRDNQGQVIISYEGSVAYASSKFGTATLKDDVAIDAQTAPQALFNAAASFASTAIADAKREFGITKANVFVTGHSLGGAEAEYVSSKLGVAGDTFGAPGLPGYSGVPNDSKLIDYVDYGDPIGNYASNMPTGGSSYEPFSGMNHVGTVFLVGSPSNAYLLSEKTEESKYWAWRLLDYHAFANYAGDLNLFGVSNTGPQAIRQITPADFLIALDTQLNNGADLAAAVVKGLVISSPDFTISMSKSGSSATITQPNILYTSSGDLLSDPGTDIITIDTNNGNIKLESFTDSSTGTLEQFITDPSSADDSVNLSLSGTDDTVLIDNSNSFIGTISNFQLGDTIDLASISATSATLFGSSTLVVQESDGKQIDLNFVSFSNGQSFSATPDGYGGTDIVLIPKYTFTFPNIGGDGVDDYIWRINNSGQILGSYTDANVSHAFVYSSTDGIATVYTAPYISGEQDPILSSTNDVFGPNSSGEFVGNYNYPYDENGDAGFIAQNGKIQNIAVVGSNSRVSGVNDNGVIIGATQIDGGAYQGFVQSGGTTTILSVPGSYEGGNEPAAISNSGEIAGTYLDSGSLAEHVFLYDQGNISTFNIQNQYDDIQVSAINDSGEILGTYADGDADFIWKSGTVSTILLTGHLENQYLTNSGEVVGSYLYGGAFSYTDGKYSSLPFYNVTGVNNSGEIAGYVQNAQGNFYGLIDKNGTLITIAVPGAVSTAIFGITDSGIVAGDYNAGQGADEYGFIASPVTQSSSSDIVSIKVTKTPTMNILKPQPSNIAASPWDSLHSDVSNATQSIAHLLLEMYSIASPVSFGWLDGSLLGATISSLSPSFGLMKTVQIGL